MLIANRATAATIRTTRCVTFIAFLLAFSWDLHLHELPEQPALRSSQDFITIARNKTGMFAQVHMDPRLLMIG
jgi:hypothetical protein